MLRLGDPQPQKLVGPLWAPIVFSGALGLGRSPTETAPINPMTPVGDPPKYDCPHAPQLGKKEKQPKSIQGHIPTFWSLLP